jgi:hypothetical protein
VIADPIADEPKLEGAVLYLRGRVADAGQRETSKAEREATNEFQIGCHGVSPSWSARGKHNREEYCAAYKPWQPPLRPRRAEATRSRTGRVLRCFMRSVQRMPGGTMTGFGQNRLCEQFHSESGLTSIPDIRGAFRHFG